MRRTRSIVVVVAAALVVAVMVAGAWVVASRPDGPAGRPDPGGQPSPVVARVPIGAKTRQLVVDAGGLWVVSDGGLHRIDPSTNRVVADVPVGIPAAYLGPLTLSADAAWVPGERSELLWRIDRATNRVSGQIRLGQVLYGPVGMAAVGDSVWVSCCGLKYGTRPAVDLVEVDVVGPEPGQRGVDLLEDRLAGQALAAGTVVHLAVHLGRQDDVLAAGVPRDARPTSSSEVPCW
jgi:hypothetical protein